ncbi:hypothetical protein FRC03_011238 [Tulasnella sp. 419]|nr:hypothetical protein FRC03_011238 [Tulasnella sp. 419]
MDEVKVIIAPRPMRHKYLPLAQPHPQKPRPIRPTRLVSAPTPADAFSMITLDDPTASSSSDPSLDVTSLDSRYNVSQEALEEFWAILRPSVLTAPGRPQRRNHPYERPHPYKYRKTATADDADHHKKRKANLARRHNSIHHFADDTSVTNDEDECFDWNPRSNQDDHLLASPPPLSSPPTPPPRPSNPFKSVRDDDALIPTLASPSPPASSASSTLRNESHCSSEEIEDVVMTCANDSIS